MSSVSVNSFVKINPSTFGATPKFDDMYGELGYVGLLMHVIWQVVKIEKDSARGEIAWCKITNPDILLTLVPGVKRVVSEGEAVILLKDLVPANMKTTLEYLIEDIQNPNQKEIAELFAKRKKMQGQAKGKDHADMKKNWKEITALRTAGGTSVKVLLPKHNIFFLMEKKELPKDDEDSITLFKNILANKLRTIRNERKNYVRNASDLKVVDVFGVAVEKRGGVFTGEGSLMKAYQESLKTSLDTPKKPVDTKANYVGIEIEFVYRGNRDALKKLLITEKLHRYVDLTEDGSLRACYSQSGYLPIEMRVICKTTEVGNVLSRLNRVFNNPLVDAYANRSCGLHVHVDMRNRDVALAYKNFLRTQNLLRGAQPVGRVNNTNCRPNTEEAFKFGTKNEGRGERYFTINPYAYEKHKTLEIRIHEGTTNCDDILNWVMFLDSIASHTKEIPVNKFTKAQEISATYQVAIPTEAIRYVDTRIERFNSLSVG